ncbi:MAG: hypothetical protein Q8O99_05810 [bacterium]|nr:hypothetical protein [bacterium]
MSRPHPNQRPRVLTILILGGIFVFGFLFPYQKNNQGGVVFQTQSYQQEESTPPSLILDVDATTEDDS